MEKKQQFVASAANQSITHLSNVVFSRALERDLVVIVKRDEKWKKLKMPPKKQAKWETNPDSKKFQRKVSDILRKFLFLATCVINLSHGRKRQEFDRFC